MRIVLPRRLGLRPWIHQLKRAIEGNVRLLETAFDLASHSNHGAYNLMPVQVRKN